ncbi:MAG: hypothetical protein ACPLZY_02855 [Candidatus Norongarragalinales archaeon]
MERLEGETKTRVVLELDRVITIYVNNDLNQDVAVQVKGNRDKSLVRSVNVGSAFTVSAGSADARTLTPDTSGFLPYLTVTLQCSTAPTSGSVTVYRIHTDGEEAKVVDALEIRDTVVHDGSMDPMKILVVEW